MLRSTITTVILCVGVSCLVARADEPASAPTRTRIAVLDFKVAGKVDLTGGTTLAAAVRDVVDTSRFELIDREMMRERMIEKDFAAMDECDQVKCLVRYGKSLDAQKVVGGYVASFAEGWVISLQLVDVNTGAQERTFFREHKGTQGELLRLARDGAVDLHIASAPPPSPGTNRNDEPGPAPDTKPIARGTMPGKPKVVVELTSIAVSDTTVTAELLITNNGPQAVPLAGGTVRMSFGRDGAIETRDFLIAGKRYDNAYFKHLKLQPNIPVVATIVADGVPLDAKKILAMEIQFGVDLKWLDKWLTFRNVPLKR